MHDTLQNQHQVIKSDIPSDKIGGGGGGGGEQERND